MRHQRPQRGVRQAWSNDRFVHAEKRGNGVHHCQHRFFASNEVEAVFVGRAAGLRHRVFVPVATQATTMHAQRAVGGQARQEKAVGRVVS